MAMAVWIGEMVLSALVAGCALLAGVVFRYFFLKLLIPFLFFKFKFNFLF